MRSQDCHTTESIDDQLTNDGCVSFLANDAVKLRDEFGKARVADGFQSKHFRFMISSFGQKRF